MARTRIKEAGIEADSFNLPITLNGTDGSSSNAGDNMVLDASASGVDAGERLLYEGIPPDIPSNISEDISVLSGTTLTIDDGAKLSAVDDISANSFNLPIILNGIDSSSTDAGHNFILDGTDSSSTNAGERLLYEGIPPDIPSNISEDIGVVNDATLSVESGSTLNIKSGATATIAGNNLPTAGAISNRNMIINGAQTVSQRGTSTTSVTSSAYFTDRWQLNFSGTIGAATVTQATDSDLPGFPKNLKIDVTTADASIADADRLLLRYAMEGHDAQRMKKGTASAEQVTLSFWVKATKTGTNVVEFFDNDNSRHTNAQYTVSSSDTWEYKTMTFPADTTGVLGDDNGASIFIFFGIACGANHTSGTIQPGWVASVGANRFAGQVNNFDSTSNNFQITGVQLECGEAATPFEYESYTETLLKCQRYFTKIAPRVNSATVRGYNASGAVVGDWFSLPTQMRTEPTCAITGTWAVSNCGQPAFQSFSVDGFMLGATTSSAADTFFYPDASSEYITCSAEL